MSTIQPVIPDINPERVGNTVSNRYIGQFLKNHTFKIHDCIKIQQAKSECKHSKYCNRLKWNTSIKQKINNLLGQFLAWTYIEMGHTSESMQQYTVATNIALL